MSTQKNEPEIKPLPCPFCGVIPDFDGEHVECVNGECPMPMHRIRVGCWNRRITPPTDTTGSGREGETPETDAATQKVYLRNAALPRYFVDVETAKRLERQRDAALAKNADLLKSENDQLADIEALTSHITTDVDAPETSGSVVEKVEWLLAQLEALRRDGERLDWLETKTVNVRVPLVYGSRDLFWSSPEDQDGGNDLPSDIRAAIDSAQRQEGR